MQKLGVTVRLTSGYHPQANGQVEQVNQEVGKFLGKYCSNNPTDWARFLPWAKYAQNSIRHCATKLTPFQCVLGYKPPLFLWNSNPTELPAVDEWFKQSEQVWESTHQHLEQVVTVT